MTRIEIREKLFSLQDEAYRTFQIKLFPTVPPETVIGVRTPALRSFAKELLKGGDVSAFLSDLPHRYFDENQLHAFLVSGIRDFDRCISEVCRFLPYVDNWATCDQFSRRSSKSARRTFCRGSANGSTPTGRSRSGLRSPC